MVDSYRLIGYENRALENEDFENDTIDAGEIGSSQTITALYEVILTDSQVADKYATFDFRYKKPREDQSRLLTHEVNSPPVNISSASDNMKFAVSITGFGLLMKKSEYQGTVSKQMVLELGQAATSFDPFGYREEFLELVGYWDE